MKLSLNLVFLLFVTSLYCQSNLKTEYFRHLRYNHISPYATISGVHPIDQTTANSTSHYVFNYDEMGRLVEIFNNHYHTEKKHPLASIGVYKVVIEYSDHLETRTFYDPNGRRVSNDKAIYKEVYSYDNEHFRTGLKFYDLNDSLMESNWGISEYQWEQNGSFIIERRYSSKKEPVNVSPYFEFGVTGIKTDKNGLPIVHYNLNEQLEVINNSVGVASYRDSFDVDGNHVKYSYYNANDSLTLNQWKFAIGYKSYDNLGNNILLEQLDTNGKIVRSRRVPTNTSIQLSPDASSKDSSMIQKISLGYLKALQKLDPILMEEVMNDSLNKVTIGYNRDIRKEIANPTSRDQMIAFAKDWNKSNTKFLPSPSDKVTILGIYNRIASVELVSDNWVEYLHLIKLDGEWSIINLIWQHKDINRYPK